MASQLPSSSSWLSPAAFAPFVSRGGTWRSPPAQPHCSPNPSVAEDRPRGVTEEWVLWVSPWLCVIVGYLELMGGVEVGDVWVSAFLWGGSTVCCTSLLGWGAEPRG